MEYLPAADLEAQTSNCDAPAPGDDSRSSQQFLGDAFGSSNDYDDEDFPFPELTADEVEESQAANDQNSDNEDEIRAELEQGWEPPAEKQDIETQTQSQLADDNVELDGDIEQDCRNQAARDAIEDRFQVTPTVVKYPGTKAGAPVSQTGDGFHRYGTDLGAGGTGDNIWAPFESKIDWEFVRWAKLRGPGSTAVTELLGIEGVSINFVFIH